MPIFEGAFQNIVDYVVGGAEAWFFPLWYLPGFVGGDYGTTTNTSPSCNGFCGPDQNQNNDYEIEIYLRGFQFVDPGFPGNTTSVPYRPVNLSTGLPTGPEGRAALSRFNDGDRYLLRDVRDGGTDNLPGFGPGEYQHISINRSTTSTGQYGNAPWYANYDLTVDITQPVGPDLCVSLIGQSPWRLLKCYEQTPTGTPFGILPTGVTFTVGFFWPFDSNNSQADRTGVFTVVGYGRNLDANDTVVAGIERADFSAVGGYGVLATVAPQSP